MFTLYRRLYFVILIHCLLANINADQTKVFFGLEHPNVTITTPDYVPYANLTSRRYGRHNPRYYVGLNFETKIPFDKNVLVDFYIFEFLSNRYQRSFVEFHYNWCNLVGKDALFGTTMRQGPLTKPCPHPPGSYNLSNMSMISEAVPGKFPFTKGRIFVNFTYVTKNVIIAGGYIDMEIRKFEVKSRKSTKNSKPVRSKTSV